MAEQVGNDPEHDLKELVEENEGNLLKEIPLTKDNMDVVYDQLDKVYLASFRKEVLSVNETIAQHEVIDRYGAAPQFDERMRNERSGSSTRQRFRYNFSVACYRQGTNITAAILIEYSEEELLQYRNLLDEIATDYIYALVDDQKL
eukprot:Nk52_evm2s1334 gene=Nk52_evmTU2s1334